MSYHTRINIISKKRPYVFLTIFFTSIILRIWFLIKGGQIEIRYWEFTKTEFLITNLVIITLNIKTITRLTKRNNDLKFDQ